MEKKVQRRPGRLTQGSGLVAGIAVTALLVVGCGASGHAGGHKASPSSSPTASSTSSPTGYVPSKWVNAEGVFVAPPDSAAPASVKAQWKLAYGVLPPPPGFIRGLGHVPVVNETTGAQAVSQAQANSWGQAFLVAQGYMDYFLSVGSNAGLLGVASSNIVPDYSTVAAALASRQDVYVVGCALPVSLTLFQIPTPLQPPPGEPYGLMALFRPLANGKCETRTAPSTTGGTLVESSGNAPALYAGAVKTTPMLGAIWYSPGVYACPTYQPGAAVAAACPPTQGG